MKHVNISILIADDSEDDLFMIKRAIHHCEITNASVNTVSSGNEAIAYLRGIGKYKNRIKFPYPTFLLTDLKMPDGDGFTVLEYLQSTPHSAIFPTIVLSASPDTDDIKRAYSLGASAYIVKPTDISTLFKYVQNLLAFWMICEVPEVNNAGIQLDTFSTGKIGDRFTDERKAQ